jgi:hypothetical protein
MSYFCNKYFGTLKMEPDQTHKKNLKKFRSKEDFGTRKKDPVTLKIQK